MMLRSNKSSSYYIGLFAFSLLLFSCGRHQKKIVFSYNPLGYYYQLLAFSSDSLQYKPGYIALVSVAFKTQADSVFWDSRNNTNGHLFIAIDSNDNSNFFRNYVSHCPVSDSACLLIKPKDFFKQQFKSDSVPYFSEKDSAVKIYFKVDNVLSPAEFEKLSLNLQKKESEQTEAFFKTTGNFEMAKDPLGFYWVSRPGASQLTPIQSGDLVTLAYEAHFLNGRLFEKSAANFEFVYGTPDQLLKGLNFVIGKVKLGQTAKILLPSRLAFGESGSSNGIVPPYTPLVYEIKIIDVKKIK